MKARPILFDRALRPEWIDFALERYLASESEAALRTELREWLGKRGLDHESAQKITLQLQRIVGYRSSMDRSALDAAYRSMCSLSPDDRNDIRLSLLSQNTPFFGDCLAAIQRQLLNGADRITVQDLYERMQELYGFRGTIPRRVRAVLQTLASFGCIENKRRSWTPKAGSSAFL